MRPEIRFRRAVGQIADEEADSQGFPERPRDCIPGVHHTCSYLRKDSLAARTARHRGRVELGPFTRRSARSWLPSRIRGFRYASKCRQVFGSMTVNVVG
jgi:hypothetical protein